MSERLKNQLESPKSSTRTHLRIPFYLIWLEEGCLDVDCYVKFIRSGLEKTQGHRCKSFSQVHRPHDYSGHVLKDTETDAGISRGQFRGNPQRSSFVKSL